MFRNFFFILICCFFSSACSEEEATYFHGTTDEEGIQGQTFLTLTLQIPQQTATRSQTNSQGGTGDTEEAMEPECSVADALVILGKLDEGASMPRVVHRVYYIDHFRPAGNRSQWMGTIACEPGFYRVLVIANPGSLVTAESIPKDWKAVLAMKIHCQRFEQLESVWQENHFLMTNAYQGRPDAHNVMLKRGEHTYKDICVQRVCARFDYEVKQTDNRYEMPCEVDGVAGKAVVHLRTMALMNVSSHFYLLKQIALDSKAGALTTTNAYETADTYVSDSDWEDKRNAFLSGTPLYGHFFFPSENEPASLSVGLMYKKLPVEMNRTVPLMYASENTLPGEQVQINQLSTGVVFEGDFTMDSRLAVKEIYYRSNRGVNEIFTAVDLLKNKLKQEGETVPEEMTEEVWARLGIRIFKRRADGSFPVWYVYWNRHHDNHHPEVMGRMEFAVVRNNIYRLVVNGIHSLGFPLSPVEPVNPWKPAGTAPDEEIPQMDVSVHVSDWMVRELEHII